MFILMFQWYPWQYQCVMKYLLLELTRSNHALQYLFQLGSQQLHFEYA